MAFRLWRIPSVIMGILYIYSYRFNTRLTEASSYALWTTVFTNLFDSSFYFAIAPQYEVYVSPRDKDLPVDPDQSIVTIADSKARGVYVDLAVILYRITFFQYLKDVAKEILGSAQSLREVWTIVSRGFQPQLWNLLRLESVHVGVLMELKRPPSRHTALKTWIRKFDSIMTKAMNQATLQAQLLFASERHLGQDEVILIAGAGDWFVTRIYRRSMGPSVFQGLDRYAKRNRQEQVDTLHASKDDDDREEDEEVESEAVFLQRAERAGRREYERLLGALNIKTVDDPSSVLEAFTPPFSDEQLEAGRAAFPPESIVDASTLSHKKFLQSAPLSVSDIPEEQLAAGWTRPMRLGSPAADFYLEFIKRRLHQIGKKEFERVTK